MIIGESSGVSSTIWTEDSGRFKITVGIVGLVDGAAHHRGVDFEIEGFVFKMFSVDGQFFVLAEGHTAFLNCVSFRGQFGGDGAIFILNKFGGKLLEKLRGLNVIGEGLELVVKVGAFEGSDDSLGNDTAKELLGNDVVALVCHIETFRCNGFLNNEHLIVTGNLDLALQDNLVTTGLNGDVVLECLAFASEFLRSVQLEIEIDFLSFWEGFAGTIVITLSEKNSRVYGLLSNGQSDP